MDPRLDRLLRLDYDQEAIRPVASGGLVRGVDVRVAVVLRMHISQQNTPHLAEGFGQVVEAVKASFHAVPLRPVQVEQLPLQNNLPNLVRADVLRALREHHRRGLGGEEDLNVGIEWHRNLLRVGVEELRYHVGRGPPGFVQKLANVEQYRHVPIISRHGVADESHAGHCYDDVVVNNLEALEVHEGRGVAADELYVDALKLRHAMAE
mmetsp:Transcript_72337/g.228033  ORF Transcript_72337/g.228033 Transcript_72337/m.228033 type:complete len:208 (-) Transcript_72337:1295-1918(-)